MTTHSIEIEGLPEGWRAVAYRKALKGENILMSTEVIKATHDHDSSSLIVEKIQPRRIVLEKTDEEIDINIEQEIPCGDTTVYLRSGKIWHAVGVE